MGTQDDRLSQLPLEFGHTANEAGSPGLHIKLLNFLYILVNFDANPERLTLAKVM